VNPFWSDAFLKVIDTRDPLALFEFALQNAQKALKGGE